MEGTRGKEKKGGGSTWANVEEVRCEHLDLHLVANFDTKTLRGHVDLSLRAIAPNPSLLILDTRDLTVVKVTDVNSSKELQFELGTAHEALGAPLRITLADPPAQGSLFVVRVEYETSPNSSGIQWLPPSQTEGKKHPYLFTQFQAIHARSGVPCQDTPFVKAPYTASITVHDPLVALMSAISTSTADAQPHEGKKMRTFSFEQRVPIPSYLLALVIGDLVSRDVGPRSRVWTEREKADAAAWEFSETESYIKTAEEILTPYEWGRYDLLMLPGSFPYGGMENPCLTFITPTLLAGDKSLTSVVAHEIAHSWMGNLVGCASWEHFWLNEGFTVFIERKILGRLFGKQVADLHAISGNHDLREDVERYMGMDALHQSFTPLVHNLDKIDPDDAFSSVPYERGFQFLYYLEILVGGPSVFEPFLQTYVKTYANKALDSFEFKEFFLKYFTSLSAFDQSVLSQIDWDAWFFQKGMPPVAMLPKFDDSLKQRSTQLAQQWINASETEQVGTADDLKDWSTPQTIAFLEALLAHDAPLAQSKLERMDELYLFTERKNAELRFRWYQLAIRSTLERVFPSVTQFLTEQGRMKYVRPLYRALFANEKGKALALATFTKHKDNYHNIAQKMVAKDLGLA